MTKVKRCKRWPTEQLRPEPQGRHAIDFPIHDREECPWKESPVMNGGCFDREKLEVYGEHNDAAASFYRVVADGTPGRLSIVKRVVSWEKEAVRIVAKHQPQSETPSHIDLPMDQYTQIVLREIEDRMVIWIKIGVKEDEIVHDESYVFIVWNTAIVRKFYKALLIIREGAILGLQYRDWPVNGTKPEVDLAYGSVLCEYDTKLECWSRGGRERRAVQLGKAKPQESIAKDTVSPAQPPLPTDDEPSLRTTTEPPAIDCPVGSSKRSVAIKPADAKTRSSMYRGDVRIFKGTSGKKQAVKPPHPKHVAKVNARRPKKSTKIDAVGENQVVKGEKVEKPSSEDTKEMKVKVEDE